MEDRALHNREDLSPGPDKLSGGRWVLFLAVLLVSISVAQLFIRGGALVGFPHELRFGEAIVLDQARRAAADPGLYPEIGKEPWLLDQYAPFYPWVARFLSQFSSTPYGAGRTLSLISTLVSAGLLVLIVRRRSGLPVGLLCAAAMLTMLEFVQFGFLMRVDPLALALAMIGCWCTLQKGNRTRVLGALAFFFAVYTRQTMLALLLVSYGQLYLEEGRGALRWPVGLLVAGLGFYGFLSYSTGGMFHQHAVLSNLFPFNWDYGIQKAFGSYVPWKLPLFFATIIALAPIRFDSHNSWKKKWWPLALAVGLSIPPFIAWTQSSLDLEALRPVIWAQGVLAFSALLALLRSRDEKIDGFRILLALLSTSLICRIGSDLNYLFEAGILTLLVCGTSVGRVPSGRGIAIVILLAVQVLLGIYQCRGISEFQPDRLEEVSYRQKVIDDLERFPDPVLSEEPWALAESGRPLQIEPFTARQMFESGMWDAEDLIKAIDQQRYSAIVRAKQRTYAGFELDQNGQPRAYFGPWAFNGVRSLPPKVQEAIERNYQAVPRTTMIERVSALYLEGREIWQPIPR